VGTVGDWDEVMQGRLGMGIEVCGDGFEVCGDRWKWGQKFVPVHISIYDLENDLNPTTSH